MGQIVRRKKKGRPSKADLARRNSAAVDASETADSPKRELRRSIRRRNVRYTFDFDDYLDDDEYFDDEEDERRREKKLKLLLKLQSCSKEEGGDAIAESTPSRTRRVPHAPTASSSSSSESDSHPIKKRKIDGDDDGDDDEEENDEIDDGDNDNDDDEVRERRVEAKGDSAPGPGESPGGLPLPEKKILELILDKLQKKDIYGVYAEPVDPEELPDYHEVIEHPMDFATVRRKLGNGSYSNFEQFESDVFLICLNAMQYNAPDTIYYKQARSIQELAKKKFEKLRTDIERTETELKPEQKTRSSFVGRKPIKKPIIRTVHEPVCSDFSSGATLATTADFKNSSNATHVGASERPSNIDALVEGNSSLIDHNLDKVEESQLGKGTLSRFGRKASALEENRRTTYNISAQPATISESIFSTFEAESKQLVPVGLYADHAYARSLARFAATLGPVAWKVASRRIEQALPPGFKFGCGWVGEYEPLPTPVLMLENYTLKEPAFFAKIENDIRKVEKTFKTPVIYKEDPVDGHILEGKSPYSSLSGTKPSAHAKTSISLPSREQPVMGVRLEGKPSLFCPPGSKPTVSTGPSFQHQNSQPRKLVGSESKVLKQVELNSSPLPNHRTSSIVTENLVINSLELPAPRTVEIAPGNKNLLSSGSFKQSNTNGVGELSNGKAVNSSLDSNGVVRSSPVGLPNSIPKAATYFPQGQEQGLSDPVQLMRMLAEKAQNQQPPLNQSPVDFTPVSPRTISLHRDDSGNAAAAAARAWMSIGAGGLKMAAENPNSPKTQISADSLYNPTRELHPQASRFRSEYAASAMHLQRDKNGFPLYALVPQHARMANEAQLHNRPIVFPQLVTADLSRFQVQSPWQNITQPVQPRQKQESLPPDLNIGFQSSASPGRQSSGVLVDSQQPDLALQL